MPNLSVSEDEINISKTYRVSIVTSCINRGVKNDYHCRNIVVLGCVKQSVSEFEVKWDTHYLDKI